MAGKGQSAVECGPPNPTREQARQILVSLAQLHNDLANLAEAIRLSGGLLPSPSYPPSPITPPDGRNLVCVYEDMGMVTSGDASHLRDTTKIWEVDRWHGYTLALFKQGVFYFTSIISNKPQELTFIALPTGLYVDKETTYWIMKTEATTGVTFVTGQQTVDTAGTPVQLSSISVPVKPGTRVTVLSKPGNAGVIYFANSEANCVAGTYLDGLSPGLACAVAASDVKDIWIDAENDGDGASFYCEQ